MKPFKIENVEVGKKHVFIIAEAGVNHEGSIPMAKKLIDAAKDSGSDMVKFQTFSADKIIIKSTKMADYQQKNLGSKQTQYELLKSLEITEKDHVDLKKYCEKKGIIFQSTAHCNKWSLDLLEKLGVSSHKIASGDLINIPLIKLVAETQKPFIISSGMGNMDEVKEAIDTIRKTGNDKFVFLHCTTNYPTPFDQVNLAVMDTISKKFDCYAGYSDHTEGLFVPMLAVFNGAKVIEKHYTLSRSIKNPKSPDHVASLEPDELKKMVAGIRNIESNNYKTFKDAVAGLKKIGIDLTPEFKEKGLDATIKLVMGNGIKQPTAAEKTIAPRIRKSIMCIRPIKKGEKFTDKNIDILRPEGGLHPREWDKLISNGVASKDIKPEDPITADKVSYKK
ncbi:MAG TPA: N-acetylneuraminate synthase family protein [Alphaproteobacteria bacterium]|nr:N-acetylneuraminate synthase family protein [Alphaproteobacteria bacterium]